MRFFPFQELVPALLVDRVVDGKDDVHVLGKRVETFGLHGVVVLLLGGVNPLVLDPLGLVLGCVVGLGYRRYLPRR